MTSGVVRTGRRPVRLARLTLLVTAAASAVASAEETGPELYARCLACHTIEANAVGPRHCGLFGRVAGTEPGFAYSAAMRNSGIRWDRASLERFLSAPSTVVPGTLMAYAGVPDADDRKRLVAYLEVATARPARCR